MIVVMYAVIILADLDLYWVGFGLMVTTVIGIGAVVAHAGVDRPFLKAATVSFVTALCVFSLVYLKFTTGPTSARPPVLPPTAIMCLVMVQASLMIGGMAGAIALGIRSLQGRSS
jgi:hypothetical protein